MSIRGFIPPKKGPKTKLQVRITTPLYWDFMKQVKRDGFKIQDAVEAMILLYLSENKGKK